MSVFNDDKKTEIIGETRIGLEEIIIPGGGQNDLWHQLQCKGRFAGEIRIEMTYYDSRPKEENASERQLDELADGYQNPHVEAVAGPRQPKPPKRRPLPANPTGTPRPGMSDHSHSSPLPFSPQLVSQQPSPLPNHTIGPREHKTESTPPSEFQHQTSNTNGNHGSPMGHGGHSHRMIGSDMNFGQDSRQPNDDSVYFSHSVTRDNTSSRPQDMYVDPQQYGAEEYDPSIPYGEDYPPEDQYSPHHQTASLQAISSHSQRQSSPDQARYTSYHDRYSQPPPTLPHGNSMPDVRNGNSAGPPGYYQPQRLSLPNDDYSRQDMRNGHGDSTTYQYEAPAGEDLPPPPPAHRTSSSLNSSPQNNAAQENTSSLPPVQGTAPLNIRKERGSFSNSPLSQVQNNSSYADYMPSPSPSNTHRYPQSRVLPPSYPSQSQPPRPETHQSGLVSPIRNGHVMPPSLIPGYEPSMAQEKPLPMKYENRMPHSPESHQQYTQYRQAPAYGKQPRMQHAGSIDTQSPLQTIERVGDRRAHRASAPVIMPQAVKSDIKIPARKSVSPQPEAALGERRTSAVPFGPDSYDAFNPFVSADSSANSSGARYTTPEQAKEAAIQHERDVKLGDGPIIGSDGRVIDPSDHLPTDTWAPEPEVKAPRKTAQVNLRFRNSPQGAQPMPPSSRRPPHDAQARPHALSTPTYNPNISVTPENISPTNTSGRARLQKRTRRSPAHPTSSPVVPTVNTALHNPVLRSTASDFPLREHENYGYGSSPNYNDSPSYGGRPSPSGIPPPVPGKVPIGAAQEDWRRDPLSEELSRIDIGVGGGRARRRYGI